jgi:hypothetical protein
MASYTVTMRPGAYSYGNPNIGDVVPLRVRVGRLDVDTEVRVLGFGFDIGEDGQENVSLEVGRPRVSFTDYLTQASDAIDALVRRDPTVNIPPPVIDTSPFPRGFVAEASGPASQTHYTSGGTLVQLDTTILAHRRYRFSLYGMGTAEGGESNLIDMHWTATPGGTDLLASISALAGNNQYICGSADGYVAPQAVDSHLMVRIYIGVYPVTPGASCKVEPNECRITLEDIGAG